MVLFGSLHAFPINQENVPGLYHTPRLVKFNPPFPPYNKSAADDFEHILSKNGMSL